MGKDITYGLVVKRYVENDGWTYQRHGPETQVDYDTSFAWLCENRPIVARGELLRLIKIYKETTGYEL